MKFKVYVDGSYSTSEPGKVYGAFIGLTDEGKPVNAVRYCSKDAELTAMRNVGGELMAAEGAIIGMATVISQQFSKDDTHIVKIYYDYKGIFEFVKPVNPWTPNKRQTRLYAQVVNRVRNDNPNIIFEFVKVKAHTGDKFNEMVDELAKGYVNPELSDVYFGCFDM